MRIKLTLFNLLISIALLAQNGINYKAIIKDTNGNVIDNHLIVIQFAIFQGVAQNNVYQETHTPTTNENGLIIVNIGEGTTSDVFTDINWSADDHFLNVKVNIGSGLVDFGTTQFMHVPYALHADKVIKLPEPYILGRSSQALDGRFSFNGKYGWQAAQGICEFSYPNDLNVRAFTLEQIAQAIVLGNWDTNNISSIHNVNFWAITPYALGSLYPDISEAQNSYGLNYNSGELGSGTTGSIAIDITTSDIGFNPTNTYLRVRTNVPNNQNYPCMCGTFKN